MSAPDPLRVLADLLATGRSAPDALELVARGTGASWAAEARAAIAAGTDPAQAVARSGVLDAAELATVGGVARILDPEALRLVAHRRAVQRRARRAAAWALVLPGLTTLSFLGWGLLLPRDTLARVIDLAPFVIVAGLVFAAGRPAIAARLGQLIDRVGRGRADDALRVLWAVQPTDGPGFGRVARLLPPGPLRRACERVERRVEAGDALDEALPSAAELGPPAASAVLAAAAHDGAHSALADAVAAADRSTVGRWRFVARLGGWAAVLWLIIRLGTALATVELGSAEDLQRMLPGGFDPAVFDELLREIEGR